MSSELYTDNNVMDTSNSINTYINIKSVIYVTKLTTVQTSSTVCLQEKLQLYINILHTTSHDVMSFPQIIFIQKG